MDDDLHGRLFRPLALRRGPALTNRFALAPLTNGQSHEDGALGEDEFRWLTMRAEGGFALVSTCAAHVQPNGKAFAGQLGIFDDALLPGLTQLASGIKAADAIAWVQLHHGGSRALPEVTDRVAPSAGDGVRGMTSDEIEQVAHAFVAAAVRAERAGFDGVSIHGAHGYLLAEFLSPESNRRDDRWGGSLENRARLLFRIIEGIGAACGPEFQLGLRLSPERFGLRLAEIREVAQEVMRGGKLDILDMSLWDVRKEPEEEDHQGRTLLSWFTDLDRAGTKLSAAGKIMSAEDARWCLEQSVDLVQLGRAGILTHNAPRAICDDPAWAAPTLPVSEVMLRHQAVGDAFIAYLGRFGNFVTA